MHCRVWAGTDMTASCDLGVCDLYVKLDSISAGGWSWQRHMTVCTQHAAAAVCLPAWDA